MSDVLTGYIEGVSLPNLGNGGFKLREIDGNAEYSDFVGYDDLGSDFLGKKAKERRQRRKAARRSRKRNKQEKDKIWNKIGGALKKVGTAPILAALLPFKKLMRKTLERHGYKAPKKIRDVAEAFFYKIVQKKKQNHLEPVTIGIIVNAILAFFKSLQQKKADGKELSKTESFIVNSVDKVEDQFNYAKEDEINRQIGSLVREETGRPQTKIILAVVGLLLLVGVVAVFSKK